MNVSYNECICLFLEFSTGRVFYVAFFNLAPNDTYMSVSIDAVVHSLTDNHSCEEYGSWYKKITAAFNNITKLIWLYFHKHGVGVPGALICNGLDVWNMRDLGEVGGSLGALVESHGAAVFSLTCNRSPGLQKKSPHKVRKFFGSFHSVQSW